ncbi:hypothetical protein [Gluconobacter sp. P5B12]|uniref:hypothetical protein n=1 Tax=Gluconobacter sp. P5B12 TaxID=2762618 RepID=UPI001C04B8AB|nr:hypothetical protein [Gluconobacter sp. P5B12]
MMKYVFYFIIYVISLGVLGGIVLSLFHSDGRSFSNIKGIGGFFENSVEIMVLEFFRRAIPCTTIAILSRFIKNNTVKFYFCLVFPAFIIYQMIENIYFHGDYIIEFADYFPEIILSLFWSFFIGGIIDSSGKLRPLKDRTY